MNIRTGTEDDLPALIDLYHGVSDAMIGTPHDCFWRKNVHPTDAFIEKSVRAGGMRVAVDEDGTLAGATIIDNDLGHDYGTLPWRIDASPDEILVIHVLTVRPDQRGQGLSRALLHACLDEARARGVRSVRLDVTVNNAPAIALYESEGFERVGEGVQLIGGGDETAIRLIVMELPL